MAVHSYSALGDEMRQIALAVFATLLLLPTLAGAQGPVVNQSTCAVSWDAPQTSADASNLTDLAGYRVYAAPTVAALAALTVPTDTVLAPALDPPAGAAGTWSCRSLAPGSWVVAVTAFDTAVPPNESGRTAAFPFVQRDDVSPSAPSNVRMP